MSGTHKYPTISFRISPREREEIEAKEHRKGLCLELILAGKLNEHLHQIDEDCNQMMERLVEQMKEKQGVTEELKMQNQMAWVGRMNNIRACAEEIVLKEIVYR